MKLMHGVLDRGLGHVTHRICTEDGHPLQMTSANVERLVSCWNEFEEQQAAQEPGELQRLRRENDAMRKLIAESNLDCLYCGLAKDDMGKCEHGFPGCGRADDLLI
jgi:hypothetical protein